MAFNTVFHRQMNQFSDIKHLPLGHAFNQSNATDEFESPFQTSLFTMSGMMGEQYEEPFYSQQSNRVVKSETPWDSEGRAAGSSPSFTLTRRRESLSDTPSSKSDQFSSFSVSSAPSSRSVNSLSSCGSRGNRKIVKPLVATVFWEEEDSLCYQVKANGIVVSRKESDDYVNGTKLLNVAGMSRGKRDGILKVEKGRRVVRHGSMNLKGVWIPFERASQIARNEGIKELLYPLFVDDISKFYKEKGQGLCEESEAEDSSP